MTLVADFWVTSVSPNIPCGKVPYACKFELPKLANRIFKGNSYFHTLPTSGCSVNLTLPGIKGKIGTSTVRGNGIYHYHVLVS